ncbi:hypothetical protein [Mesobacillus boroniphilus]|uniref:Uncharacterized protein n=1 Tax=Mesobacillus boroniphilus JCM 21738 TaxID=1294265 RepID=W4RVJ4_9BACI|nr:hypothetical protein [Mesobacillus boroniphilus]GAE48142.1 hypothetical protein JCM21738_5223 [Mesobacillus boroniphilus JCM 21738]
MAEVTIEPESNIPLQIYLENYNNPSGYIKISNETNEDPFILKIKAEDFQYHLIETVHTSSKKTKDISLLFEDSNSNIQARVNLEEGKSIHRYKMNIAEYLLDGHNSIEIIIISNDNSTNSAAHFVTTIEKKDGKILILQKTLSTKMKK